MTVPPMIDTTEARPSLWELVDTTDWRIGILVMQGNFDGADRLIKEKLQKDNAKKDGAKNG